MTGLHIKTVREEIIITFIRHEWGKMENYDICLNTSVLSEEECVELLMKLAG